MRTLRFVVVGTPQPAGSKNAYVRGGRAIVTDANPKSKDWKRVVANTALGELLKHRLSAPLFDEAVEVSMTFTRVRPKSHLTLSGLSAEGRRHPFPDTKPDVLKLARGVEDALTGIVYSDDARIVRETLVKVWGSCEQVEVIVSPAVVTVEIEEE